MVSVMHGTPIIAGRAAGLLLVGHEPLSFWGGYDHRTGEIIDRRHPLAGTRAAGRVLALPFTRGSSTTTAVLLEALRAETAPAAIITTSPDPFFALAAVVADVLYGAPFPLIVVSHHDFARLPDGAAAAVDVDGTITVEVAGPSG